ncbi:histone-lysine N-methyltransferase SETDB1-B-like [Notothenia coriiceps]|uniref:Histone-lysine N-methyltransferase SETDB1-B-like n=1 Tax=Notothenia coriiceps TaxID=8208 RepID=A0A6I9MID2_9TELE|nr:PREDICTED: histone-lysine N-methyltransferase SETDB1-B-like [Notothenia coriiceps]
MKKAVSLLSLTTPNSNRKRRRLRDTLAQLTKETEISPFPPPRKRPSAEHSLPMGSLLDISNTPDTCKALAESLKPSKSSTPVVSKQSARWQVSKELYQTESNYVEILNTILQLFKIPLEKEEQVGGPILAQEEMKTIFGSIPEIHDVHTRIKGDLEDLLTDWSDDKSVGDIILKYVSINSFPEDQQPSTPEDDSPSHSVIMEADEIELTKDELRTWIKQMVKQDKLIESDVLQKCTLIQAMVDRKIQRASELVKLCESVEACEAVVRKQYALLGWDYRDTDSEDDDATSCESTLESTATLSKSKKPSIRKELVVVLTRLSENQIKMFCPPTPLDDLSENESSDNSDCDELWDPKQRSDDSDSDSSVSSSKPASKRRRKGDNNQKCFQSEIKSQHGRITAATSNEVKTPQASANTDAKSAVMNTPTRPAKAEGASLEQKVSVPCQKSDTVTETAPSAPLGAIKVTMSVLARRKAMSWRRGIIVEMMEREDGRMKYKIQFESKGKSLVSGHHIAFDYMPKVESLLVGSRVVVKHQTEEGQFCPGTLAELPSRKNRMRFLVFMDDHTPLYVNLPSLHLVCRPCKFVSFIHINRFQD